MKASAKLPTTVGAAHTGRGLAKSDASDRPRRCSSIWRCCRSLNMEMTRSRARFSFTALSSAAPCSTRSVRMLIPPGIMEPRQEEKRKSESGSSAKRPPSEICSSFSTQRGSASTHVRSSPLLPPRAVRTATTTRTQRFGCTEALDVSPKVPRIPTPPEELTMHSPSDWLTVFRCVRGSSSTWQSAVWKRLTPSLPGWSLSLTSMVMV
mmetsp:Transcript_14220/g.53405  ORF Transcript_14220/g.53405 Transcript_14220/m.53405 type:complete len:208 (+) Transcript_14220:5785-6408(+)